MGGKGVIFPHSFRPAFFPPQPSCRRRQVLLEELFREEFDSDLVPRLLVPVLDQQITSHSIPWI